MKRKPLERMAPGRDLAEKEEKLRLEIQRPEDKNEIIINALNSKNKERRKKGQDLKQMDLFGAIDLGIPF